jgi:hypothetical protein
MWLTTRVGVLKQRIMERHVGESTEDTPSNVTINVHDESWQEVYFRNQKFEETSLTMKVYMGCLVVISLLVIHAMFA